MVRRFAGVVGAFVVMISGAVIASSAPAEADDTGTITIVVDAIPDDAEDFNYHTPLTASFFLDDDPGDGTLPNSRTLTDVPVGLHTITQSGGVFINNDVDCDDANSTTNVNQNQAHVNLEVGEHVTCTWTNTKRGAVTIIKDAVPDHPQDFSYSGLGELRTLDDDPGNATLPNSVTIDDLFAGDMVLTEFAVSGWSVTDITCDDPTFTKDLVLRQAAFHLSLNEHVTCTFTGAKNLQPDGTIAKAGDAAKGRQVLNSDGTDQTVGQKVKRKKTGTFTLRFFNNGGVSESFILTAPPVAPGFKNTLQLDGTNVTAAVTGGGLVIGPLAPDASAKLTLKVKVKPGTAKGEILATPISAKAQTFPNLGDTVTAKVTVK